ncbi:hypothetical protein OEZ86_014155 [Tetradesmus obliquus]|nr:hypothetical protein OEZ86_014155 [Tetradesmus obliquus]
MVLSRGELAACLALVLYFLYVLTTEGYNFCQRLVQHHIPVPGLQPGLLAGTRVDVSDHQWREFRASMPLLSAVMAAFVAGSRAVQAAAPQHRLSYYVLFSLGLLAVLHGAAMLFVVALAAAGFFIAKATANMPHGLLLVWAWHCGSFLLVRVTEGLPFALLSPVLAPLDAHRGMLRWHIYYNLLLLRMLSFASDYHWQRQRRPGRVRIVPDTPPHPDQDLRTRSELWQDPSVFNLRMYLAYCLYPPTYIAGPTSTFNAFASQMEAPAASITAAAVLRYAARGLGCWLCMEVLTHNLWFMAVVRSKLWLALAAAEGKAHLSPLEMCLVPWWIMIVFWLKFTVIWRFFRAWALADGMDVPENMRRCICNNYDIAGFWQNWHASYNLWLVRYMYIPLGGAAWRLLNVWPIFTFVALWHDLEPRLLGWAWLMALFIAPELLVKWMGRQAWCIADKKGRVFRYVAGLAAAFNVLLLIAANMVGFVLGLDGVRQFVAQVLGQPRFLPVVLLACFCGVQLMLALRDWEAARAEARVAVQYSKAQS